MDTCPHVETSRSSDREYCPACGAPAVRTPQTMTNAWQAYRQRRTLGSSGAWNILWGVLIMGSGMIMLRESGLNALLPVHWPLLIGTGSPAWAAPPIDPGLGRERAAGGRRLETWWSAWRTACPAG